MPLTIHSPQPSSPLKRKLFDGALTKNGDDDDDDDEHNRKRNYPPTTSQQPRLSQPLKRRLIERWLVDTDHEHARERPCLLNFHQHRRWSDSCLTRAMSFDRPRREVRAPRRYEDDLLPRVRSVPTDFEPHPMNTLPAPFPFSPSPALSIASFSRNIPTPTATENTRTSSRVKAATYRSGLFHNNIIFEEAGAPARINEYALTVLGRKRDSPGLEESQLQDTLNSMRALADEDEDTIKAGYISTRLFPGAGQYPGKIKVGSNIPFEPSNLPHVPMAPPLPSPRPDQHYCLDSKSFTAEEDAKQSTSSLRQCAKPSTAGCWPYFTVEFKSEARGGTFWVAENQNATSGALCVNSLEKLTAFLDTQHTAVDTISFSCNVNAKNADIWVHYCENQRFFSAELQHFHMRQAKDIIQFRTSIRNIIEFGFRDRLPQIKNVLARLALPDLEDTDKKQRTRKPGGAEVEDDEGDAAIDSLRRHKRTQRGSSLSNHYN